MATLIAGNFVYFESLFGAAPIFALFAFMMVLQLLFVWKVMPETNGISFEDLEGRVQKMSAAAGFFFTSGNATYYTTYG